MAIAIMIPMYFYKILEFFVLNLSSGWVFGSIYIRLLVIIMFTIALYIALSNFQKTKKIKFIYVFLISLLPGFGISFIEPIYDVDYGLISDELKIENLEELEAATEGTFKFENKRVVLAFFTTSCPHCKMSSHKIGINKRAGMEVDVHTFFPSTQEEADNFLKEYNGETFTAHLLDGETEFTKFAGFTFPSIYVIDPEGNTEKHWTGDMINYTALDYLYDLEP